MFFLKQSLIFLGILGAEAEAGHKVARCPPEKLMSCLCKEHKLCCFDETLLECSRQSEYGRQVRYVYANMSQKKTFLKNISDPFIFW